MLIVIAVIIFAFLRFCLQSYDLVSRMPNESAGNFHTLYIYARHTFTLPQWGQRPLRRRGVPQLPQV